MTTIYDIELTEDELILIKGALQSETMVLRDHTNETGNESGLYRLLALDILRLRLEGIGQEGNMNHSLPVFIQDVKRYMTMIHWGVLGHKDNPF